MQPSPKKDASDATTSGTPVRQLSVFLENRVGALMALVRLLREQTIAVLGLSVQESTEMTLLRLVLSDPESAETLFMEKGVAHTSCVITVVELADPEDALAGCLAALLAAEINIRFSYPLLVRPGHGALLALHLDDVDVGAEALHNAGYRVLLQEDLSR
jgi:hypothetical protein